jgi:hypothetical protein
MMMLRKYLTGLAFGPSPDRAGPECDEGAFTNKKALFTGFYSTAHQLICGKIPLGIKYFSVTPQQFL